MQSYKTRSIFSRIKASVSSQFEQTKWRTIVFLVIVLLCFIAGIVVFVATPNTFPSDEYLLDYTGVKTGITAFLSRLLSILVIMGLCCALSIVVFTLPVAVLILGFRGYLLGFNLAALCAGFGLNGIIDAILIVLPCQFCMLALLSVYLAFITKAHSNCKRFGEKGRRLKIFMAFFMLLMLVNLVETILMCIFSPSAILVI